MLVKIKHCFAFGEQFENIKDGSIHEVIPTPKGESDKSGWWVMGNGEPVLILFNEAEVIKQN